MSSLSDSNGAPGSDAGGARRVVKPGGSWLLDAPKFTPAVWGDGTSVLWAMGEPLIVAGPPGVGKSTLVQQVILKRVGLASHDLNMLGHTVTPDPERRVLYLALDRSAQIRRSLARMVVPSDRDDLDARLGIVEALPFDPLEQVDRLAELCRTEHAGTLVVDSLYNLVPELTKDGPVLRANQALKAVIAEGCEVVLIHHNRKATADNRNPNKAADLYGSRFIEAGAGSVFMLEGEAGGNEVTLHHRKQPVETVGPLELVHDHEAGVTTSTSRPSVVEALEQLGGGTVAQVTALVHGENALAERAVGERVRRKLDKLVADGKASKSSAGEGVTYTPTSACSTVRMTVHAREGARTYTPPENSAHATSTQAHATAEGASRTRPLMNGGSVHDEAPAESDELADLVLDAFPNATEVPADG